MTIHPAPFDPSSAAILRDRAYRTVSLYLLARLRVGANRDGLCRVRNMSASGLMLESELPLEPEQIVTVEFRNGMTMTGRVAWTRDNRTGLHSHDMIDVPVLLHQLSGHASRGAAALRAPRFGCGCKARVRIQGRSRSVPVGNISINGVQMEIPAQVGDILQIDLPGLPERAGRVRWCHDGQCGIMLMEPYSFLAMARWLASQDRISRFRSS